jgi:solute carrier family 25 phosphate transporter 23/24/25/41
MRLSDVVSELELEMEEPQNQRDKRVEELWKKLDPAGHGELDLKGLQKGLRRIDHRKVPSLLRAPPDQWERCAHAFCLQL